MERSGHWGGIPGKAGHKRRSESRSPMYEPEYRRCSSLKGAYIRAGQDKGRKKRSYQKNSDAAFFHF